MTCKLLPKSSVVILVFALFALPMGCGGDGDDIFITQDPSSGPIDATAMTDEELAALDVTTTIDGVSIASPPVVTFTYQTADGRAIMGLEEYWEASNRYIRFTITKLVPGLNGDPDSWVAYTRDASSGDPDYDTGSSFVSLGGGKYRFTFNTDVRTVAGVPYEPTLTHRVAGQIGSGSVPLEAQNMWLDLVPAGGAVTMTRNIAVMDTCNDCHEDLVFHGRRFEVEYCVQCHNPDLASGEGDFAFMVHRIHAAGTFTVLDGGVDYSEVTYPQNVINCSKCHKDSPETPEGDNWMTVPHMMACTGCHSNVDFATGTGHGPGLPQGDNQNCALCHGVGEEFSAVASHTTANSTPNNPQLFDGQRNISYELVDAVVDGGSNEVTIQFRIMDGMTPLDLTNLPVDLTDGMGAGLRYPTFLLAYAMAQDGIAMPADFNNFGRRGAQPISINLDDFSPIATSSPLGMLSFDAMSGVMTATITDAGSQFPIGAGLRTIGLQNYLQQDLDGDGSSDVSLHALSDMVTVTGDNARRSVIATANCSDCHEWFEGHGGNRVLGEGSPNICTMCHVPNQSSSGRTVTDPTARGLDAALTAAIADGHLDPSVDPMDPLTYPEDAQNFKDMIHGIHASGFRDRPYQHVRGPGRQDYYDWSEVTFPRGASTSNCSLCHEDGTFTLPLPDDLLATTVRTTAAADGLDPDNPTVEGAFVNVPNGFDWVNSPVASSCYYCHTNVEAWAHMAQNGGSLSVPPFGGGMMLTNRSALPNNFESCSLCHGPGKTADIAEVHNR